MIVRSSLQFFAKLKRVTLIRTMEIIFDHVRVLDNKGKLIGDMPTTEGVKLAKSKGLDLFLINFHQQPPVCQISDLATAESSLSQAALDDAIGYSFDPTSRPATIQLSSNIADEEFGIKMDILRKHLLQKKRCEVVVLNRQGQSNVEEVQELVEKILAEVNDISKLADTGELVQSEGQLRFKVWPCTPEQINQFSSSPIEVVGASYDEESEQQSGHGRKHRRIRNRIDPKLRNL